MIRPTKTQPLELNSNSTPTSLPTIKTTEVEPLLAFKPQLFTANFAEEDSMLNTLLQDLPADFPRILKNKQIEKLKLEDTIIKQKINSVAVVGSMGGTSDSGNAVSEKVYKFKNFERRKISLEIEEDKVVEGKCLPTP